MTELDDKIAAKNARFANWDAEFDAEATIKGADGLTKLGVRHHSNGHFVLSGHEGHGELLALVDLDRDQAQALLDFLSAQLKT